MTETCPVGSRGHGRLVMEWPSQRTGHHYIAPSSHLKHPSVAQGHSLSHFQKLWENSPVCHSAFRGKTCALYLVHRTLTHCQSQGASFTVALKVSICALFPHLDARGRGTVHLGVLPCPAPDGTIPGPRSPPPFSPWPPKLLWGKWLGPKEVNDLNKRNFFVLCKSQYVICY